MNGITLTELLQIFPALVVIGAIISYVGFGLILVSHGINFMMFGAGENLDKKFAEKTGIFLFLTGIIVIIIYYSNFLNIKYPEIPTEGDPFFKYYFISVVLFLAFSQFLFISSSQDRLIEIFRSAFILEGGLITMAVIWRGVDVIFYIINYSQGAKLFGLESQASYVPYFILLGSGVLTMFWMIAKNTKNSIKLTIYSYFIRWCIYLLFLRVVWEVFDYIAQTLTTSS